MKKTYLIILLLCLLAVLSGCRLLQRLKSTSTFDEISEEELLEEYTDNFTVSESLSKDVVVYADGDQLEDSYQQSLDIYRTREMQMAFEEGQLSQQLPVLVYVHGGGWIIGNKDNFGNCAEFFTSQNFIFITVNYQLLPEGEHPNNVMDVTAALSWVYENIEKYGGNPEEISLMGHSAGAHLVSLAATNERFLQEYDKSLSIIKHLVVLDTGALDVQKLLDESKLQLYRDTFGDDPETITDASPYENISEDKGIPPFLLFVAGDNQMHLEQSQAFAEKLNEAGIEAEIIEAPDKTHSSLKKSLGTENDKVTAYILEFILTSPDINHITDAIILGEMGKYHSLSYLIN